LAGTRLLPVEDLQPQHDVSWSDTHAVTVGQVSDLGRELTSCVAVQPLAEEDGISDSKVTIVASNIEALSTRAKSGVGLGFSFQFVAHGRPWFVCGEKVRHADVEGLAQAMEVGHADVDIGTFDRFDRLNWETGAIGQLGGREFHSYPMVSQAPGDLAALVRQ
jgi:hypothetical protein